MFIYEVDIVKWFKKEGDYVKATEPLFVVTNGPITTEFAAINDGILVEILKESGRAEIGETIGYIEGSENPDTMYYTYTPTN